MNVYRNTTYNVAGSLLPIVVSLLTIPVYFELIGAARYGLLAITWLLIGYLGLFEFGIGRATTQRIAEASLATPPERSKLVSTAAALSLLLGCLGGLILWAASYFLFSNVVKVDIELKREIIEALPVLALIVPVATLSSVFVGVLQGVDRFLASNLIAATGAILFQILPLFAAKYVAVEAFYLILSVLVARVITLLALISIHMKLRFVEFNFSFESSEARRLLTFGGWLTISSVISPLMVLLDRFLLGAISGAASVAYYTIPFQLAERTTLLANSLGTAMLPAIAGGDHSSSNSQLIEGGQRLLLAFVTPAVAVGVLLMEPFLFWWIGDGFASTSTVVGQVVLIGFWINGFGRLIVIRYLATGKPDVVAKCHLAEVLPYFGLLALGVHLMGILGAAIVFALRVLFDFLLLAFLARQLGHCFKLLLYPFLSLVALLLIAPKFQSDLDQMRILISLCTLGFIISWSWRNMPPNFWESLKGSLPALEKKSG